MYRRYRRRRQRRPYRRNRRSYRRTKRYRRRPRRANSKTFHVRRTSPTSQAIIGGTAGGTPLLSAFTFDISSLQAATDFTELFDEYRINCVVVTFSPVATENQLEASSSTTTNTPRLCWAIDYSDAQFPATVDDIKEYENCRDTLFNKQVQIKIFPKVQIAAYRSLTTTAYIPKGKQWINCAYPDCLHYGLKFAIYGFAANQSFPYTVQAKYYLSFKNVK